MSIRSRLKELEKKTKGLCVKNTNEDIRQIKCQLNGGHEFIFIKKARGYYSPYFLFYFECQCGKEKSCHESGLTAKEKTALKTLKYI